MTLDQAGFPPPPPLGADQVADLAHLNVRDTASRAPQTDIARLKARMGWEMPWYTITDSFDVDFGVDERHGHNVFIRDAGQVFRTYFINSRGDEAMGSTWSYLDATPLGRQETWETRRRATPRARPTHGGTGTTITPPMPRPTRSGPRCRMPGARLPEPRRRREGMTEACHATSTGGAGCDDDGATAAFGIANWLCLAGTPTFAIMALMTGVVGGGPMDMLCSAGHGSPLTGMVPMYVLMSAFHLVPWLKLISRR